MKKAAIRFRDASITGVTLAVFASMALLAACDKSGSTRADGDPVTGPANPDPKVPASLVIEEIVPGNVDLLDERGEDPGWVEISNTADTPVPLGAWRMRGDEGDGPGWRLPDTSLPPGGRMLVFFSGLDRRRTAPAGDTLRGFGYFHHAWSDSMNIPPGHSSFGPWEIAGRLWGNLMPDSLQAMSIAMILEEPGRVLNWSAVEAALAMPGDLLDASGRDRLLLRATIPEGQPLVLRFCETDQQCYKGATLSVVGTGRRLDTYDLSLLGLATDFRRLAQIQFIPPVNRYGTYRFTASDVRFYRSALRPHASFELHRKGGVLHLEDTSGAWRQSVSYPEMPATASWARLPPSRNYAMRNAPSPEAENPGEAPPSSLPAPTFLTATGYHAGPVDIRLAPVPGAILRCAEGGQQPGLASPDAAEGIHLDSSRAVSCAVFDSSGRSGPVASGFFLIGEKPSLPVVSIIVDSVAMFDSTKGLYMEGPNASAVEPHFGANYWEDTELPAQVAFLEKGGRQAFSENAGMSIFGNWTRDRPKRPLSIQFREKYGARRIDYPLFPQHPEFTRFKGFALRNMGGDYAAAVSRDALGTLLTEGRDLEYQLSRYAVVYINGRYWGIYDMRERLDADYLDTRFGFQSDGIDLIKNDWEVQGGTAAGWNDMVSWFLGANLSDSAPLARAAGMLDLDNMATYLAAEIWASNTDWPANNTRGWRRNTPATPWRMMLFDLDGGLAGSSGERNMFPFLADSTVQTDYPNGPRSTVFFRKLSANPAWRSRFANRLCVMLATNFAPARTLAALDSMGASLTQEIKRDMARWNLSSVYMTGSDAKIRSFLQRRPASVLADMQSWYGLGNTVKIALAAEGGRIAVEGFDLGIGYQGVHFEGLPIRVQARAPGKVFAGWSDGVLTLERTVVPGPEGVELTALFR
ncbi:MAG: CotH kinase family protein [Fibrobacteria bacterium]